MLEISRKDGIVSEEFGRLIGELLSYIDVSVDSVIAPGDQYPKKALMKKTFEKFIYNLRTELFRKSEEEMDGNLEAMFRPLTTRLVNLSSAAFQDGKSRESFLALVAASIDECQERIQNKLGENKSS